MNDFVVIKEHPSLIKYIDQLQKKNAEALSFYPKATFEREQQKGRLFLGLLNGEPCGYLYVGAVGGDMKCHQVCIEYDARRRLYGAAIVSVMEQYAWDNLSCSITLRCGFDLEANDFWKTMGYQVIAHHEGGVRRMRTINVWRKLVSSTLFQTIAKEPMRGVADASLWKKNKSTGVITQFTRGKRTQDYRAKLIASSDTDLPSWLQSKPTLL